MKNINLIILMLAILFTTSCKKTEMVADGKYFELVDNDYSFKSEMGNYEHVFVKHDGYQGLRLMQAGLFSDSRNSLISGHTKDNLNDVDLRRKKFFFNDLSAYDFHQLPYNEQYELVESYVGKEVNFKYVEDDGEVIYDVSMYVPKPFIIDKECSEINKVEHSSIGEFKVDSKICYNADPKNESGLLVILSYHGESLSTSFEDIQSNHQNFKPISRVLHLPTDDGVMDFPDGFFDKIPDGALLTLHLARNTYYPFNIGEDTHLVKGGVSYDNISLVLKR